jgi:hypothetical protein
MLNSLAARGENTLADEKARALCRWLRACTPRMMLGSSILICRFTEQDLQEWRECAGTAQSACYLRRRWGRLTPSAHTIQHAGRMMPPLAGRDGEQAAH